MECTHRCEGCPFGGERITSRGPVDSDLVIVGEAPGAQEINTKRPFVGPSGQLLWDTLTKVGLAGATDTAFITNALRCRPPAGPIPRDAIESCKPRLLEELGRYPRKLIISLGNTANRAIFGDHNFKITQQRGSIRLLDGTTAVIPVLHPAAILRNPGDYSKFKEDLSYAVRVYLGETPKHPGETRYTVVREEQIPRAIQTLRNLKTPLACDIETSGFNPRTDRILALGIAWKKNTVLVFPGELVPKLVDLFDDPEVTFVWHNGKFDTAFLRAAGLNARVDDDTMLQHYALDEQRGGHGLKDLATDLLGAGDYDAVLKKYLRRKSDSYAIIPRPVLHKYLAQDADYTGQIHSILRPKVAEDPWLEKLYTQTLIPASSFLQRVEANGMPVDVDALEHLGTLLSASRSALEKDIQDEAERQGWDPARYMRDTGSQTADFRIKVSSPLQMRWLIYVCMGIHPTKKGIPWNTSKAALAELPQYPIIRNFQAWRKIDKAYNTYVKGTREALQDDCRVHSTYLIHGTVTGRLSSRGPNLQNIPRDSTVRRIFTAPPGRVLIDADFASHELRCLAHLSKDSRLISVFTEGRDLHDEVTRNMYHIEPDDPFWIEARIRAKAVNFGIAYGRGAGSIAQEYELPLEEAQRMVNDWFGQFPGAAEFLRKCRDAPIRGGALKTPFGRKRRFHMVSKENLNASQNEASNFPISSLASDLTLLSAMRMESELERCNAMIVNLVHDSIVVEVDDIPELIERVVNTMMRYMRETPNIAIKARLPFDSDAKVGKRWGELKKWKGCYTEDISIASAPTDAQLSPLIMKLLDYDDEQEEPAVDDGAFPLDHGQNYRRRAHIGG